MIKKITKISISIILILVLVFSLIPTTVFAYEYSQENIKDFSSESGISFVIREKASADGTLGKIVAKFENGDLTWVEKCNPSTDYYIYLTIPRNCDEKYLMLSTGGHEDGRPVGTIYQNIPGKVGSTITPRELDKTDVLESIVYYQDDPNVKYGMNSNHVICNSYTALDGTVIYKIRKYNGTDPNGTIDVCLGVALDGSLYDNAENIFDALHISIGDYDEENHTVVAEEGYEQSVSFENIVQKGALSSNASGTQNAILDKPSVIPQSFSIGRGNSPFLYDSMEFDLVIPEGVELNKIGFTAAMNDYDANGGSFTITSTTTDATTGSTIYHIVFEKGLNTGGGLGAYFQTTIKSTKYSIGDTVTLEVKNAIAHISDHEDMDISSSKMKINIIDGDSDDTMLSVGNRTVYNSTIDTDEHYKIELSRGIVIKPSDADSPFDKVFEAKYNVYNADAKITTIVIPKGRNDNPTIEVTGINEAGETITVTIDNPNKYILKSTANVDASQGVSEMDFEYVIPAEEIGLVDIKSSKANIGAIKSRYNYGTNSTSGSSTTVNYEYNAGGAYGYFTTPNSGIQVISEYRLYNENPAYRNNKNGDLSGTSTYTSTDIKIAAMRENSNLRYYYNDDKDYTFMSWFKGEKDESGNLIVSKEPTADTNIGSTGKSPSLDPGSSLTMMTDITLSDSPTAYYRTYDTEDKVVLNTTKLASERSTVEYLADPVFYLTLPSDFKFIDIAFQLEERKIIRSQQFINGQPCYPESIWNYLYDNVKSNTYVSTKNLECLVENVTYLNTTGDGRNIYKITFPNNDAGIGYYSADGTMRAIKYAVQIGTSKSSVTTRYPLSDLMQISAENPVYGAMTDNMGVNYTVADRYGVNDGGDLSGVTFGPFITGKEGENREVLGFLLQKLSEVVANNYCRVTKIDNKPVEQDWYSYNPSDPNSIALLGAKSEGQYKLVISNSDVTHATKELQAVVPIPKKGANMGTAFMEQEMQYDMEFSWDENTIPDGFTYTYIKINNLNKEDVDDVGFVYELSTKEEANAILIETESLGAGKEVEFVFDFVIGEDAQQQEINIFYNAIRYTDFQNVVQGKVGSDIAVEVAKGKLSGVAFYDVNRNGVLDEGEELLPGVNVRVVDNTGKFQYTTTDENGYYEFNAVREKGVNVTYSVDKESSYRLNVPTSKLSLTNNCLAASTYYSSLIEEELDVPLDKYVLLSYDANPPASKTASGDIPKSKEYYSGQEVTVASNPDNMSVPAYQFVSWNTQADGKGTTYNPNSNFIITEDTVLYAQWEPKKYTITFDYQGGTIPKFSLETLQINTKAKATYSKALSLLEASGHLDDDLVTIPYELNTVRSNKTVGGYYLRDAIAVYYGLGPDKSYYPSTGNDIRTLGMLLVPPGSNDPTVGYNNNNFYNYFYTEKNGYNARFFYDNYDGKVSTTENKAYSPWYYLDSNGNKVKAAYDLAIDEKYFDKNNNVTLYLNWLPKTSFTVNYDSDGGSTISSDKNVSWEADINNLSKSKTPKKAGSTFLYWTFDEKTIPEKSTYGDLAVKDTVESITLKAVYSDNDYTVNYNSNGGSEVDSRTVKFNEKNMNSIVVPTKTNYVFKGWSTDNTEDNIISSEQTYSDLVNNDEKVTSKTLNAIWELEAGYTVLFDSMGGSAVSSKTNLRYDATNLISGSVTTKNGYEFVSWTTEDGTKVTDTTSYSDIAKSEEVKTITLYANWKSIIYTIEYTNVEEEIPSITREYEQNNLLPNEDPTKRGYNFTGWTYLGNSVSQSNTVESLNPTSTTLVMKANWENINYTVEYDTAGGTVVSPLTNQSIDRDNLFPQPTSTKNGYVLEGWYDESGEKITSSTKIGDILVGESTTAVLTAHWTPKTGYTVNYDLNGGNIDGAQKIDSKSVAWDDSNLTTEKTPVKDGYNFVSWAYNTKTVDSTTTYGYLATYDTVTSITLVAKWEKKTLQPSTIGATLYLGDKTGVNFYVDFGADVLGVAPNQTSSLDVAEASQFKMHFTMKDSNGKILATEVVPFDADSLTFMNVKGEIRPLYKYTHWNYAYEMTDTIEATIYNDQTPVGNTKQYSMLTYANNMLGKSSTDEKLKDSLKGMLVYGAEAQKYWSHNLGLLATSSTYLSADDKNLNNVDLSKYAPVKIQNISGISDFSLALKIKNGAGYDMKFGITTSDGVYLNELKAATLSSKTVPTIKKNGKDVSVISTNPFNLLSEIKEAGNHVVSYQMTIEDIPVFRWDDEFTVKLNNASGSEYSVTYSLLTYGYVINGSGNKEENLLRAMAKYNEKSKAYFITSE